jgi:hypothetical protein
MCKSKIQKMFNFKLEPVRLLFSADHVDVVGDEEFPDTGHTSAPRRNESCFTEIRSPFRFLQFLLHAFVFTSTDLKICSLQIQWAPLNGITLGN